MLTAFGQSGWGSRGSLAVVARGFGGLPTYQPQISSCVVCGLLLKPKVCFQTTYKIKRIILTVTATCPRAVPSCAAPVLPSQLEVELLAIKY